MIIEKSEMKHQSPFSRSVVSQQTEYFPLSNLKRHIFNRQISVHFTAAYGRKRLAQIRNCENKKRDFVLITK
jgi:hypothetical protein